MDGVHIKGCNALRKLSRGTTWNESWRHPPKINFKTWRPGDEGKANSSQPWGCHDASGAWAAFRTSVNTWRFRITRILYVVLTIQDSCSLGVCQEKTKVGAYLVVLTLYDSEFGAWIPLGNVSSCIKHAWVISIEINNTPNRGCHICKLQIWGLILPPWVGLPIDSEHLSIGR